MGRGATETKSSSLLYGESSARRQLSGRYVVVSGLQLPGAIARPRRGLDAWIIIGSLAAQCRDDSAWDMFSYLATATLPKYRIARDGHQVTSKDLKRALVVQAFENARNRDKDLRSWALDEAQWDICMRALSLAHSDGGFEGASTDEIAETYRELCGVEILDRGDLVLCVGCRRAVPYSKAVSGEAWRPGFGHCGYLCGAAECVSKSG